jgi:hypothetical protein
MFKKTKLPIMLFCVAAGLLPGCADTDAPRWLTGEPPREEIESYQGPIAMPPVTVEGKTWPNLGDVPPRPKMLMEPYEKVDLTATLQEENAAGQKAIADYVRATAPVPKQTFAKSKKSQKSKKKKAKKK